MYFDYIDSDSNFSDGISRALRNDAWATKHAISTKVMQPETSWWTTDLQDALEPAREGGEKKKESLFNSWWYKALFVVSLEP